MTLHGFAAMWWSALTNSIPAMWNPIIGSGYGTNELYAFISWLASVLLVLCSLNVVRRWSYTFFYYTHIPLFLIFIVFGVIHGMC